MIKNYKEKKPIIDKSCFIAESADVIGDVTIGKNSSVWYNCVLRADGNKIEIGENTNVQDGTIMHIEDNYPTIIGDNVTIGHKAIVHACTLKNNVLIGMGAIILNGAIIEENVLVGAGSVVTPGKRFPSGTLVLGSPAKVVRDLTEEEIKSLQDSADHYVKLSQGHK
ncbi:gamma carbonic anhydrase family protein [Clostridium sp. D2Q-11]|uniref:Gamma carbonic anhydrase family protein n=1 Tax=Anaeromonas frigoriresistens TaxID=2683708 RepID=A0A942UUW5_9FIRM|nr:gamma carbonic anhydrase family protein [Anaeromonas frigoriresistens]MBS4539684.1 gamma carbonic anhydrase family protein [Anaeromonas frigoriresistens]